MTTATFKNEPPNHTYQLAQRLQGLAVDGLYTFTPGTRELDNRAVAWLGDYTATGSFTFDEGIAVATVWARHTRTHELHAAAQARADIGERPAQAAYVSGRILHFRSGPLLWTGTTAGQPVAYTALGAYPYQVRPTYDLDGPTRWHLTAAGHDVEHPHFTGIHSALIYITSRIETQPAPPQAGRCH